MSLFSAPILVVDTETTGFPTQPWAAVVDLAAVRVEPDGTLGPSFSCLIRPEVLDGRCTEALRISGLTPEQLIEGGVAPVYARQLWERWVKQEAQTPFLTAYNVAFDRPMLAKMGIEGRWCSCIMERATEVMGAAGVLQQWPSGAYRWPKLVDAAAFFGVAVEEPAHRALADATTAARVLVALKRREGRFR